MVHILDNIWQQRITLLGYYEESLTNEAAYDATELHEDALPTLTLLRERWLIEQREMQAYLDTLTKETLNSTIRYNVTFLARCEQKGNQLACTFTTNMDFGAKTTTRTI